MQVSGSIAIEKIHAHDRRDRRRVYGENRHVRARIFVGGLSLVAGLVHLVLAGHHFEEAAWLGTAFLADGLGLSLAGIWLLTSGTKQAIRAAEVIAALTVLAYLGSRTIGLPGMDREAWDALGLVTTITELAIVVSWPFLDRPGREAGVENGLITSGRREL